MTSILNRSGTDFDPAVSQLIKHKARRLATPGADRQDAEQELALHVVRRMPRCDSSRAGPLTFVDRILANRVASMLQHRGAAKRDRHREVAMDDSFEHPAADGDRRLLELKLDVREAFESLPPELVPIATLFMKFGEAEVARRTGSTRGRVRQARRCIARHLVACGVGPDSSESQPSRAATR
jgi:hypothetical protein